MPITSPKGRISRIIRRAAPLFAAAVITACSGAGMPTAVNRKESGQVNSTESTVPKEVMVRVHVWDDTKRHPIHEKSEIWFRGYGSWWLKPATKFGSAAENLGRRTVGQKDTIAFYPDGRNGQEILIPFTTTVQMNPNGSPRDSIVITISDEDIEIVGLPIKAATGETTLKVKRSGKK